MNEKKTLGQVAYEQYRSHDPTLSEEGKQIWESISVVVIKAWLKSAEEEGLAERRQHESRF